jgi:hypothetical protein
VLVNIPPSHALIGFALPKKVALRRDPIEP